MHDGWLKEERRKREHGQQNLNSDVARSATGTARKRGIGANAELNITGGVRGDNWSEGRLRCRWPEFNFLTTLRLW
jgi:hypothetical protein